MRSFKLLAVLVLLSTSMRGSDSLFTQKEILNAMERVADWQLNAWKEKGSKHRWWDWTNAAGYTGLFALGNISNKPVYHQTLIAIGDSLSWETGPRRFHADDYCIGQTYSLLYSKYKEPKMISNFRRLGDSIAMMPHDESLEWKNNIANREWAWCDALFMGPTALGYLSAATNDKKYREIAYKLWWKTTDYLYDPQEKLYYRDQNFFDKKENNGAKVFWSRGNGWVFAGLARVIESMPRKHVQRKKFVKLYKDMAAKIASIQQPDGSWHASLLDPASYPIQEMSGTGFYTYGLMWGINNGLLDWTSYWPVVSRAWVALNGAIHPDGMLGYIQPIGAAPGKVDANSTEIYGVGAFLLAGSEIYKQMVARNKP